MKPLPIVALVGQPNAGKSTLLNKITGRSLAVTSAVAGTTRDRQYIDTAWNGAAFTLVDTAGLGFDHGGDLEKNVGKQIDVALTEADVIIFVADGKEGVMAVDKTVLKKIRAAKKPVMLCVNKLDSPKTWAETLGEFSRLGVKPSFGVSAVSGRGIGDMLDAVAAKLGVGAGLGRPLSDQPGEPSYAKATADKQALPLQNPDTIAVSIVGKPNVGKSSLFNAILKKERVVVSPVPGTTRAAIDENITMDGTDYTFIDTAGLKRKDHRQAEPDVFSGFQSFKSIRRSDVCFLVIDATEEITKQDQHIAGEILNMQKGCVILANKIDLAPEAALEKKGNKPKPRSLSGRKDDDYNSIRDYISTHFPFFWMCPMFFVSAVTGKGLQEALSAIKPIYETRHKIIDADVLKEFLAKVMKKNPPKLLRDQKKPKVFSLRQTETNPPKFELLVNHPAAISQQFRKFLENSLIKELGFWGTPITLRLQGKDKS